MEKNVEPLNDSEITRLSKAAGKRWLTHWECQSLFATITDLKEKLAEAIRAGQKMHDQAEAAGLANIGLEQENKRLRETLGKCIGYMLNAKIDIETGAPRRTAIATIEGGLNMVRTALSHKEGG